MRGRISTYESGEHKHAIHGTYIFSLFIYQRMEMNYYKGFVFKNSKLQKYNFLIIQVIYKQLKWSRLTPNSNEEKLHTLYLVVVILTIYKCLMPTEKSYFLTLPSLKHRSKDGLSLFLIVYKIESFHYEIFLYWPPKFFFASLSYIFIYCLSLSLLNFCFTKWSLRLKQGS